MVEPRVTYNVLPTGELDKAVPSSTYPEPQKKAKNITIRILAAFAIMYAVTSGLRQISRSFPAGLQWIAKDCHGLHRNHSTITTLPTHYTLPSGDKIPAVALGKLSQYSWSPATQLKRTCCRGLAGWEGPSG